MTLIRKLAAFIFSATVVCSAHAGPAAAATPAKTPTTQLILIGLGLVVLFGRRDARTKPWTNH